MRVVVTGGTGFIGSAVCRYLVGEVGATVLNLDKLGHTSTRASLDPISCSPRYSFRKTDIANRAHVTALLDAFEPAGIIHLAAQTDVDCTGAAEACIETNVVGTYRLLEAVRGYWAALPASGRERFRFLHVSTDEVGGSMDAAVSCGEAPGLEPSSPYAASKAAADQLVLAWHRTCGLPTVIARCARTYGPYEVTDTLVPSTIVNALEGRSLVIDGNGANARHWLYVDDHVRALRALLTGGRSGDTYDVGGRSARTELQVVERIADLVDELRPGMSARRGAITFANDGVNRDCERHIDTTKIETETGWKAQIGFETGLRRTVRWYSENECWWRAIREARSGAERLGAFMRERVA